MALATTCPQCKTSFKVIPDQLKLRRGLVRCGVCQHVFSGIDYLRYVDDSAKNPAARGAGARGGGPQALPARMPDSRGGARDARNPGASTSGSATSRQPSASGRQAPTTAGGPATGKAQGASSSKSSPRTIIAADDDLKTAFFLADSEFGPYSQTRPEDVHPPTSIRQVDSASDTLSIAPSNGPARSTGTSASSTTLIGTTGIITPDDLDLERPLTGPRDDTEPLAGPPTRFAPPGPASAGTHSRALAERSVRTGSSASALFPPLADDESDDDDPDTRAANQLARDARLARRNDPLRRDSATSRGGSRRRDSGTGGIADAFADGFQSPARRFVLVALLLLALIQTLLIYRDELASGDGFMKPIVTTLGWPFALTVYPVRDLQQLGIESFEILESRETDRLVLSAVLVNRGNHAVRWPAMELTLTDASRQVVVRKVITSAVYLPAGARHDGIGPRSEVPIRLALETRNVHLAGYNVGLFYP